jgi:hypothetical protein
MTSAEVKAFESNDYYREAVALRHWMTKQRSWTWKRHRLSSIEG